MRLRIRLSNCFHTIEQCSVLALERTESVEEIGEGVTTPLTATTASPYISFVSVNLKVYDIYFDQKDLSYSPRIGKFI